MAVALCTAVLFELKREVGCEGHAVGSHIMAYGPAGRPDNANLAISIALVLIP
jgi:hypothetical protein